MKTILLTVCAALSFSILSVSASPFPAESAFARLNADQRVVLLNPLDDTRHSDLGRHNIQEIRSELVAEAKGRIGARVLRLTSISTGNNGKASFWVPAETSLVFDNFGFWVYLDASHNINQLGLEVTDAEGEMLLAMIPLAGKSGWHWLEFDPGDFRPSFNQPNHNGRVDQPLRRIGLTWFAPHGENSFLADGLVGITRSAGGTFSLRLETPHFFSAADPIRAAVTVNNPTPQPRKVSISWQIQRDSRMIETPPPHPDFGTDIAYRRPNHTIHDDRIIDSGSLTDGVAHTYAETPWGSGNKGARQLIDLQQERRVHALAFVTADANWLRKVDVSVSLDGLRYLPVEAWQGINLRGAHNGLTLTASQPFNARFLRFDYHDDGEGIQKLTLPAQIKVFDGLENETWEAPQTGDLIDSGTLDLAVPAGEFALAEILSRDAPGPGAYLFSYIIDNGDRISGSYRHLFVRTPPIPTLPPNGRFGLNINTETNAPWFREMGISWVRYENHKWNFVSPAPDQYFFDGSVAPWRVPLDRHYEALRAEGLQILPYLFQTPRHFSSAPDPSARRVAQYPPTDLSLFADFVFQSVARYGSRHHPAEVLKSNDKLSGLNLVNVYSLWNEPNLNSPDWGHFIGPFEDYLRMFRYGAEAVKKADPDALVATAGFAGIDLDIIDQLASFTYPDGRRPVDFADILNAHHYTARQPPETARVNTNIQRGRDVVEGPTFEERVLRLYHWRQRNMPGREMWMTETGYDTGGHESVTYREQAARIPRLLMIALGSGFDQVHLYRSYGSTPRKYEATGIFDNEWNPKPSAFTMATVIQEIDGFSRGVRLPHEDEAIWLYAWEVGDEIRLAAWTIAGDRRLGLNLGEARVTDSFGYSQTKVVDGDFVIGDFPFYFRDVANKELLQRGLTAGLERRQAYLQRREEMAGAFGGGFDFGLGQAVGSFDLGSLRRYIPVLGTEAYTAERGFGFEGNLERIQASERRWSPDPGNRDELRLPQGTSFVMHLPPGQITIDISANERARLLIDTGSHQRELEFTDGSDYQRITLEVGQRPIRLTAQGHTTSLRWLRAFPALYSEHVR